MVAARRCPNRLVFAAEIGHDGDVLSRRRWHMTRIFDFREMNAKFARRFNNRDM